MRSLPADPRGPDQRSDPLHGMHTVQHALPCAKRAAEQMAYKHWVQLMSLYLSPSMPKEKASTGVSRQVRTAGPQTHPSAQNRPGAQRYLRIIEERRYGLKDIEREKEKQEQ